MLKNNQQLTSPPVVVASILTTKQPVKIPRKHFLRNNILDPEIIIENEQNNNLDIVWHEKAKQELGETKEIIFSKIKQLQHLILLNNLIPNGRRDDAFLLRFLRAKKFDVDKTIRMMQKYYSMKRDSSDLFKVSPVTQMRDILEMQIQLMLPHRDFNGRQIFIFRVEKCDPYKCAVEKIFKSNVLALEHAIRDPRTQIGGLVVLLDMSGVGFGHAKFLSPHLSKRTVEVIQETFPMRFKAFHILHEPFYFDAILTVLKPFLKEKIRRRIFTHGNDLNSLHKHIPKEILPLEYGGQQKRFDNQHWRNEIFNTEDYFIRLETFNYDVGNNIDINNNNEINNNNNNNNNNGTKSKNNLFKKNNNSNKLSKSIRSLMKKSSSSSSSSSGSSSSSLNLQETDDSECGNDDSDSSLYEDANCYNFEKNSISNLNGNGIFVDLSLNNNLKDIITTKTNGTIK